LEKNTVRSIENFSTGLRGSASAEYFLKKVSQVIDQNIKGLSGCFSLSKEFIKTIFKKNKSVRVIIENCI